MCIRDRISAGEDGEISLTASSILMEDGSSIEGIDGDIFVTADGLDLGDVTLGRIETAGGISINAAGDILDGTFDELPNLVANRLDLVGNSIGDIDDIETQVDLISFNASENAQINDVSGEISLDRPSSCLLYTSPSPRDRG